MTAAQARTARVRRQTSETDIDLELGLDGSGRCAVDTGIGFFDHMLDAFARHGLFDLELRCRGDLEVDPHHSVEDVGICLGQALDQALGDRAGIQRFAHSYVPMDEALARVVIDLSGRSYLCAAPDFRDPEVGGFPVSLVTEFFRALSDHGRFNLHVDLLRSGNDHHGIEAIFKAFAQALDRATRLTGRSDSIPSTKGRL